jgi:hypothetical protein
MTRRATTTRRSNAHDSTKALLKAASTPTPGRHRSSEQEPAPRLMPGTVPIHRPRRARAPMPKM